jgi:hypothetical protein
MRKEMKSKPERQDLIASIRIDTSIKNLEFLGAEAKIKEKKNKRGIHLLAKSITKGMDHHLIQADQRKNIIIIKKEKVKSLATKKGMKTILLIYRKGHIPDLLYRTQLLIIVLIFIQKIKGL